MLSVFALDCPADEGALEINTLYGHHKYDVVSEAALSPVGKYRLIGRTVELNTEAGAAFIRMRERAGEDGVKLVPIFGFRSFAYQDGLFKRAIKEARK